jgi:hypothetical protein
MDEPTVTADMVLEVAQTGRERAERIAAYATLRFAGASITEAARETGIPYATCRNHEKWVRLLRERFDLPAPPKGGRARLNHVRPDAGASGGHQTNHVGRGVVSPDCPLCWDGSP